MRFLRLLLSHGKYQKNLPNPKFPIDFYIPCSLYFNLYAKTKEDICAYKAAGEMAHIHIIKDEKI